MSVKDEIVNEQVRYSFPLDKSYEINDHTEDYLNLIPGRKLELAIEEEEQRAAEEEQMQNEYSHGQVRIDIENSGLQSAEPIETTNVVPFDVDSDDGDKFGDLGFLYTPPKPKYTLCCHKSIIIIY